MWPENYSYPRGETPHPEEELAAFALNALDDAEFQAVFHHVVQCLHCQEVLLGFQETSARLTGAAPETALPDGLKRRILARATGKDDPVPAPALAADPRWSARRLRRWLAPAAVGALSVLLAVSVGIMALQQREIDQLSAAMASQDALVARMTTALTESSGPATVETGFGPGSADSLGDVAFKAAQGGTLYAAAAPDAPSAQVGGAPGVAVGGSAEEDGADGISRVVIDAEQVDRMKQDMAEVVEATVLSAQPETEKVPMISPMGTEPEAKGVLMVEPNGRRGVLMVSGMPADTYQIWLVRGGHEVMVDRVVVNEDDGAGVKQLEMDESIFHFHQVALRPDERHGPTKPAGERILTALIIPGPPTPPR